MPISETVALKRATARYEDFTGHDGKTLYEVPDPNIKGREYGALFGKLDYLGVIGRDGRQYWLRFEGRQRPGIASSADGYRLFIVGEVALTENKANLVDTGTIFALAYTTRRDGKSEAYIHEFRPKSRPRLRYSKRGLLIVGGRFVFIDTGINDR